VLHSLSCRAGRDFILDSFRTTAVAVEVFEYPAFGAVGTVERTTIVKERDDEAACSVEPDMRLEMLMCTVAYSIMSAYGLR
jgi:hypothetical protein